jgi:hypothetical protein
MFYLFVFAISLDAAEAGVAVAPDQAGVVRHVDPI